MIEKILSKDSCFLTEYLGDISLIQRDIDKLLSFDKGVSLSNRGGYQSNLIDFGFNDLTQFLVESLKSVNINCMLNSFWLNINDGKSSNVCHIHESPNFEAWSAVYYHKVCCDKSTINFHHLVPTIRTNITSVIPQEKMIIFFPGIYPHSVSSCNNENHQRISIAFNFEPL
jgi:hypothetical protein